MAECKLTVEIEAREDTDLAFLEASVRVFVQNALWNGAREFVESRSPRVITASAVLERTGRRVFTMELSRTDEEKGAL